MRPLKVHILISVFAIANAANPQLLAGEPVTLATEKAKLYGTLDLPTGNGKWPIALIIGGSGPTDRDGNQPASWLFNNHLKLLSEALTKKGVATLRYDKRGIGQSQAVAPQEKDLRFDAYVHDAVQWGKQLRSDKRFNHLYIIGHSEGALIGSMASQKLEPAGFIAIAGTGDRAGNLLREQMEKNLSGDLRDRAKDIITHLERGETVAEVPPDLFTLYRPSVQPYLISWFKIDPAAELRRLKCPVLVVSGTTDIQVAPHQAELLAKAREHVTYRKIDGMNHVLKMVPDDRMQQINSYYLPQLPISEALVDAIVAFIRSSQESK
jgi:uncharacterized protein